MKAKILGLAAVFALVSFASSASAAIYDYTFTGTIVGSNSTDALGLFGTAGASLSGDAFQIVYTLNTANAGETNNAGTISELGGGAIWQSVSLGSAVLTINGTNFTVAGTQDSDAYVYGNSGCCLELDWADLTADKNGIPSEIQLTQQATNNSGAIPSQVASAFALSTGSGTSFSGNLDIVELGQYASLAEYLTLDATNLTVVDPPSGSISGVPEPATWAMMLIGFGLVGLRLRHRAAGLA
jgi:hypothetical protein